MRTREGPRRHSGVMLAIFFFCDMVERP
jgi:hypothetical protein